MAITSFSTLGSRDGTTERNEGNCPFRQRSLLSFDGRFRVLLKSLFGERGAALGRQPDTLDSAIRWSDAALWVVPNPSGLNAHETVATLAAAYAAPAAGAGVIAR